MKLTNMKIDIDGFLASQKRDYPAAATGYEALKGVKVKEFDLDGCRVKVQFNPARAVSSGAKVDKKSIAARPCFLCEKNRDPRQTNIPWKNGKYEILINPFPIFPRHLTIPATGHHLQTIGGRIGDMFDLAKELDGFTVFYNGPRCGASAPDHMHFQAGDSSFLPIWEWIESGKKTPMDIRIIDATSSEEASVKFEELIKDLVVPEGDQEPMMNVLAKSNGEGVRILVIPRKRHRPSFYDNEGEEGMMISPASVDLGGVFILPREIDFNRIDSETLKKVYEEVTL